MRILVVGATGFLGLYVFDRCKEAGITVAGTSAKNTGMLLLDMTSPESISKAVSAFKPDCVINCAAMTNVDECEKNPGLAMQVNAEGPRRLAQACGEARLVHVSTDAVFDGVAGGYSEESEPNPVNAYARSKLEGDRLVASTAKDYVVVRTNLYGLNPSGKGLLNWILSSLAGGKEMTGFTDVVFNPLWARDLAGMLVELSTAPYSGILNCAGDEVFTKYEFCKRIADALGYKNATIKPGVSGQSSLAALRPKKTYLKNDKMHGLLKTKIHSLGEVLHDPSFDIYRQKGP
ncbi:MAG: SDR family oxidoreductase [Nitrososphaera sp.]